MLKIGLTGGIASGKSTVCQLFSQLNITIIDSDQIARDLVQPGEIALTEIVTVFGSGVLLSDGALDRIALRHHIFSDPIAKKQLEKILHPKISDQLTLQSNKAKTPYCILDIPLLIESKLQSSVDRILVIDLDEEEQLKRLCLRDAISPSNAQKILASQCSRTERLYFSHDIILNDKTAVFLEQQVADLHKKYLKLIN